MGFLSFLSKIFGNKSERDLKALMPIVAKVKDKYAEVERLSNDELRTLSAHLMDEIANYVAPQKQVIADLRASIESLPIDKRESVFKQIDKEEKILDNKFEEVLNNILPEAFAIVKSTAARFAANSEIRVKATDFDRQLSIDHDFVHIDGDMAVYQNHWMAGGNEITWDMVHYDVQLIGGVVLHQGKIAEMATGEGKTLVATLPVFLNALTHNGVHVVTVNDYLAKRDSEWMGPIYMFHGLSVDCIDKHKPNSEERRKAYQADITFGTNNEFGFDYLRDNMAISPLDLVQRKHNFAIVDEVDSVLIDDARTPLIISGPVPRSEEQLYDAYKSRVEQLYRMQTTLATRLLVEAREKMKSTDEQVQDEGVLALFRSYKAHPKNKALIKFLSEPGVKVRMQKKEEYYMQENNKNMHEATDVLYFVIDERNKTIDLTDKGIEELTGKAEDPMFFVLPDVGSEMAEVENSSLSEEEKQQRKDEILQNYSIKQERVHTIHQLLKAYSLFENNVDYVIMDGAVKIVDEQTGRIMEGRRWSDGLHQAVEAKENVKVEAATQTFATITLQNYFRMYHKLSGMTGTAETEAGEFWDIYKLDVVIIPTNVPVKRIDMNDRIYKTQREKFNAVIEEVQNLVAQGRPVLVGTTDVDTSELLSRMLTLRKIPHNVLNAKQHQREAAIVAEAGRKGVVTIATNMAGRGTDIKLTPEVRDAGGLAIIGTTRHESRRVDRQLRGRAGRQGDPGTSVFFVSLEDSLIRLFGGEKIASIMDRMGLQEGEVIEHSMINRTIERAQKKVEENNFGIRKRLLEYDDVMNAQRNVIYSKRRHALMGERIGVDITNMVYDMADTILAHSRAMRSYEQLVLETRQIFTIDVPFNEEEYNREKVQDLANKLAAAAIEAFKRKMDALAQIAYPVIKDVYENHGQQYQNILVPITDGKLVYNIAVNLEQAYNTQGQEVVRTFEKRILLHVIDDMWKDHLLRLDDLKQSAQNASYEQKDPLVIYKNESFAMFSEMMQNYNTKALSIIMRGRIHTSNPEQIHQAQEERRQDYSKYRLHKSDASPAQQAANAAAGRDTREKQVTSPIVRTEKKIGRNDLCPCGSGKKYKNCHGKDL